MVKPHNKIFIVFVVFSVFLTASIVFWSSRQTRIGVKEKVGSASEIPETSSIKETKVVVISPDGKYTLTMDTKEVGSDNIEQKFYISSDTMVEIVELNTDDLLKGGIITIPFNTFSPDNKFIFLMQTVSEKAEYFVLRTDGEKILGDKYAFRLIEPFNKRYPDLKVTDVTGWGGLNLIVVNTDQIEGGTGPSFWFDLSNFSFIRLSHRFN